MGSFDISDGGKRRVFRLHTVVTVSATDLASRLEKGGLEAGHDHSEIGVAVLITRCCLRCMRSSTLGDEREI